MEIYTDLRVEIDQHKDILTAPSLTLTLALTLPRGTPIFTSNPNHAPTPCDPNLPP